MPSVVRSSLPQNIAYSIFSNIHDYCTLMCSKLLLHYFPPVNLEKHQRKNSRLPHDIFHDTLLICPPDDFSDPFLIFFPGKVSPVPLCFIETITLCYPGVPPELKKVISDQQCLNFPFFNLPLPFLQGQSLITNGPQHPVFSSVKVIHITINYSCVLSFAHLIINSLKDAPTTGFGAEKLSP